LLKPVPREGRALDRGAELIVELNRLTEGEVAAEIDKLLYFKHPAKILR
jgi:hypothetical protein